MKRIVMPLFFLIAISSAFLMGSLTAREESHKIKSAVVSMEKVEAQENDWGNFYSYYSGETYGTKDVLTGVALINPGMQIHPPHVHAEEEYLMVTEGQGIWHLNGNEFVAKKGDILYAAPWDIHGITNTGKEAMTFVVWKWNNKGIDLPVKPE